jgi:hypothetical protein
MNQTIGEVVMISVLRNSASVSNAAAILLAAILLTGLSGCDSAEKYQKQAPQVQSVPEPVGGELALTGSREQMAWVKDLAESLDAARLKYELRDTAAAIAAADSLAAVAEATLDTLPIVHSLSSFLSIYIADVCGTLQDWQTARGNHEAVSAISRRYAALAARLQARRDSAAAAQEP